MDEVRKTIYDGLKRYYIHLFNTGNYDNCSANRLLIATFMVEMLEDCYSDFLDENGKEILIKAMHCLYGGCILPYPTLSNKKSLNFNCS